MRETPVISSICISLLLAVAPAHAADADPEAKSKKEPVQQVQTKLSGKITYRPPAEAKRTLFAPPVGRGKPEGRVAGGSRGQQGVEIPSVYAVVPDHVAQTADAAPSIFWYVDRAPEAGTHMEFALNDERVDEPLVEIVIPAPSEAGFQRIKLDDLGVSLEPGVEYEWSIAIVIDPEKRGNDVIVSGWIDRIDMDPAQASEGSVEARALALANRGLWYDALAEVSDGIERGDNGDLPALRADLLRAVGLEEVVD